VIRMERPTKRLLRLAIVATAFAVGTIKNYITERGFGFITPDNDGKDHFFVDHVTNKAPRSEA
jgi:hypothetical protein